jgi:hypothetical protein
MYSLWFPFVAFSRSGSPGNRTQRDGRIRAIRTTSPRLPIPVGRFGVEPKSSCSQSRRASICTSARSFSSHCSSPYGNRTHLSALKGQYPSPIDERAVVFCVCVHAEPRWAGRRSNPRYLIFSQALYRLSYQPKFFFRVGLFDRQESQRKRPGVAMTPGLMAHQRVRPSVMFAYFFRLRARNPPVHSPVGQMSRSTAVPAAISV